MQPGRNELWPLRRVDLYGEVRIVSNCFQTFIQCLVGIDLYPLARVTRERKMKFASPGILH